MAQRRPWWATWPGVIAMWLASALLAWPGLVSGLAAVVLPDLGSAGLDFEVEGPPAYTRVVGWVLLLGAVVLPLMTARWARKMWLGYLLLGLALCGLVGVVGLVQQGVL